MLAAPQAPAGRYGELIKHPLFRHADRRRLLSPEAVDFVLRAAEAGPVSIEALAARMRADPAIVLMGVAALAKMGFVRLENPL